VSTQINVGALTTQRISSGAIIATVSASFGLSSVNRQNVPETARQIALYMLHEYGGLSYSLAGALIGVENASRARYGVVATAARVETDEGFRALVDELVRAANDGKDPVRIVLVAQPPARVEHQSVVAQERNRSGAESAEMVELVLPAVATHFGVSISTLMGPRRDALPVLARHVAAYLLWRLTDLSLPKIAGRLNRRDHTSAMYARDRISEAIKHDSKLAKRVHALEARIRQQAKTAAGAGGRGSRERAVA